jgi:hypothetical protein
MLFLRSELLDLKKRKMPSNVAPFKLRTPEEKKAQLVKLINRTTLKIKTMKLVKAKAHFLRISAEGNFAELIEFFQDCAASDLSIQNYFIQKTDQSFLLINLNIGLS